MSFYMDIRRLLGESNPEKAPTVQENIETFKRIEALKDSPDATGEVDDFITANFRLVASALIKFINRHPEAKYLVDDLFSVGLFQFTKATHTLLNKMKTDSESFWITYGVLDEEGNLPLILYLYISVAREIQRAYEVDAARPIAKQRRERWTPPGKEFPIRKVNVPDRVFEQVEYDSFREIFLLEEIIDHCKTGEEEEIITLAITKSYRQIAKDIGRTTQYVLIVKDRIYERFCNSQE